MKLTKEHIGKKLYYNGPYKVNKGFYTIIHITKNDDLFLEGEEGEGHLWANENWDEWKLEEEEEEEEK